MAVEIDVSRHKPIFNPFNFKGKIGIVGCGSLGSALAIQLAKLGLADAMVLLDFDLVENHNLANQILFGPEDIGVSKSGVCARRIHDLTGTRPNYSVRKVCDKYDIEDATHLFVCVDSMEQRKQIFKACVFLNPRIEYFADGRLGARQAMTYSFDPRSLRKSKEYLKRWYPDEDVERETGGCGFTLSIGATAMIAACQMTWNFMDHMNYEWNGKTTALPFEEKIFRCDTVEMRSMGYL